MNCDALKNNLDFYEKINKVNTINDKLVNKLQGSAVHIYNAICFNYSYAKFDPKEECVIINSSDRQIVIRDKSDTVFKLTYLHSMLEDYLKNNSGLRLIYDYINYTKSDFVDLRSEIHYYLKLRESYIQEDKDRLEYLKAHIEWLRINIITINDILKELE